MRQKHSIFRTTDQKLLHALFSFVLLLVFECSFSQRVINSTGNTILDNTINIEYSVGEIAITTLTSSSNHATQGLLQPTVKFPDPACMVINDTVNYFPNPTENILRIVARYDWITAYRIYAADGKLLRIAPFFNNQINLNNFPGGVYFIKLYPGCNDKYRILKVVKQ